MLQIKQISKKYVTGDLVQTALDSVTLNLRNNEFVAILGPSGSGKTTLLNVIGGLDRYDSGDLVINNISTKQYKDRDWDSYRNHTIGFVFQSYNLIPHQSVLANVELALTISGIKRSERRRRAKEALEKVGLGDQLHKKPNQMSGGQMQRVAIARALVNNPSILLADEPTGALDTETSVQVMELLKEVAKDRLVVMVTHNPDLAQAYATRIVRLKDGKITDDSNPCEVEAASQKEAEHKNMGKSSMSLLTAMLLSFNNLKTKKARTFLTSFAGSIGIIGIAMILSFSNGVNTYISDVQKDTMSSYPVSIQAQALDLSGMMKTAQDKADGKANTKHEKDQIYSDSSELEMASAMTGSVTENNLTAFKKYLDDKDSEIQDYIGENGVIYSYDTKFDLFSKDPDNTVVNTDGSTLNPMMANAMSSNPMAKVMGYTSDISAELTPGKGDDMISKTIKDNYDVLFGSWPQAYDEVTLLADKNNEISLTTLYALGLLPAKDYQELYSKITAGEQLDIETQTFSYEELCNTTLYLIPECDYYVKNDKGTYDYVAEDHQRTAALIDQAIPIHISAIIRPAEDSDTMSVTYPIGYTKALTDYLIRYTNKSDVVTAQMNAPEVNVINGMAFSPSDDAQRIADTKTFISNLGISDKAKMYQNMISAMGASAAQTAPLTDESMMAAAMDQYFANADDNALLKMYDTYISTGTYQDNITAFGVVDYSAPSAINIYADSFEDKDKISECIANYNEDKEKADQITYTDYVGMIMNAATKIIDIISYVLVAFVAVSLVVSSIMIGIITYISVLERTKEIGILRAIGASKHNISQVFNAETFLIGLCAGLIGIGITLLLLFPVNALIHALADSTAINAIMPVRGAIILVILSVILTIIGGLIPSKKAANKDPVTALRTE